MKIRLEQLNPTVGDLTGNKKLIVKALQKADNDGIELLILPEMVVTGYPLQDLLEKKYFRDCCYQINQEIIGSSGETAILFGSITDNPGVGRTCFNSAILAKDGEIKGVSNKTLLPTYDVFDDFRYFEPNKDFNCLELDGISLGVTICEDIWYNENEVQYHTYEIDPAAEMEKAGADCIINISASPYTKSKHESRMEMLKNHARDLQLPVFYSNQVGSHTDIIFDGDSAAINADAEIVAGTNSFQPSYTDVEFNPKTKAVSALRTSGKVRYPDMQQRQFRAIELGLQDYIQKTGITEQVLLGLSGGIDSALVCTLAAEILGPDKVTAITMPSEYSSSGSVTDSEMLAENLGVKCLTLPIADVYQEFQKTLKSVFEGTSFGVAEENLQSRIRGTLLMAYANKYGNFLLATGNKSEYAVGYATLYGDMNGALAIIGDLYKTEVFEMAKWFNRDYFKKEVIPENILKKPPSAELRPNQKDSDSLPYYEVLDDILYRYIELQQSAQNIVNDGLDPDSVRKVIQLVDGNEFKRYQAAPILKLCSKSFGIGRRWPMVQKWTNHENRKTN